MSATAVMEALSKLSPEDLREIQNRASFLLDPTSAPASPRQPKPLDKDIQQAYAVMKEVLEKCGESVPPVRVLLRDRRVGPALRSAAEVLGALLRDFKATHPAERFKVLRLVVGLSAQDLNARNVLTTLRLAQRLRYADRTVDRHFPGYRASGLLPMILSKVPGDEV
jgi:hypothetical protein